MRIDFCIIGLGNPGNQYLKTRHNIGYQTADKLAGFFKIKYFHAEEKYAIALSEHKDKTIVILKPLTYMNLSGLAVRDFLDTYEIPLGALLIVFDDLNLPFGTLRLRPSGSDGGQKGMYSIIYELGTENFSRLRIGIGNEEEMMKFKNDERDYLADYVLSEFTDEESRELDRILDAAKDAAVCFIDEGIEAAMNRYNRNVLE